MSILLIVALGVGGAAASLLLRPERAMGTVLGSIGLALLLAILLLATPGDAITIGRDRLVLSGYVRLFLGLGAAAGLALTLLGLAAGGADDPRAGRPASLPIATLVALAALAVALSASSPLVAVPAAVAAAAAGLLVSIRPPLATRTVESLRRELRVVAITGVLLLLGVGWAASLVPAAIPASLPADAVGLAFLAVAAAVALRAGAIPFHAWVTRLAATAPRPALPLLLAWLPAGLLLVAIEWDRAAIAPLGLPLELERGIVIGVGVVGLVLGVMGAWLQEDVALVVAYSVVQDAGFGLLALGTSDPTAWAAARTWLLAFVVVKTAFVGWAVALHGAFGSGRLDELGGWSRRSPLLGLALLAIVAATIGWPGLVVFEARVELLRLSLHDPVRTVALIGGLASLLYYGRLAAIGLARPSPLVDHGADWRPRRPAPAAGRVVAVAAGGSLVTPADGMPAHGIPGDDMPAPGTRASRLASDGTRALDDVRDRLRSASRRVAETLGDGVEAWRLNRAPAAAALALLLSFVALAVAGGGFGASRVAAEPPALASPGTVDRPEPSPTGQAIEPLPSGSAPTSPVGASLQPLPTE